MPLSAIARMVRSGDVTEREARAALTEAAQLRQELVAPDAAALQRAVELQARVRVLDGLYVALAERRSLPLVTSDTRIGRADPPCEVVVIAA